MKITIHICSGFLFCLIAMIAFPTSLYAVPSIATGITTTLTVDVNGNGNISVQPAGPIYTYGEVVTLTATADANHLFVNWAGDLTTTDDWYISLWDYRVPVHVGANGHLRTDKMAEVPIDFAALLTQLGATAAFDPNSVRVVEIDATAQIIDNAVPHQFDDTDGDGKGTLIFLMKGTTTADQGRTYHVYFDVTGKGFSTPSFTDLVTLTDGNKIQGQVSFEIATATANYVYHKDGGGFARIYDIDSRDWIDYRRRTAGSGGTFRGIPNMIYPEGQFHPGNEDSTSVPVTGGPLKETIRTTTDDGKWEATWEFFPAYARMTVLKADHDYWFLYEGTPGGSLEVDSDFITRSDGTETLLSEEWQQDLVGEEWVYVSDPNRDRSLFLINHNEDNKVDSYRPMNDLMTVFGFGRQNGPLQSHLDANALPAQFTIGLIETVDFTPAAAAIRAAYKDLSVQIATPQQQGGHLVTIPSDSPVITLTMTSNRALTANFAARSYTLTTQSDGNGTVIRTPDQESYLYNTEVTLEAEPATGWRFERWHGDETGNTNPLTLTIDADKVVTGTFVRIPYSVTLTVLGAGTVEKTPDQTTYFYDDRVTLTATSELGWNFVGWSGDLVSTQDSAEITIQSNQQITATFARNQYTLAATAEGDGSIDVNPVQEIYLFGDEVTVTATPATGWEFAGWQGDITGTATSLVFTMDSDKSITAQFTQKRYLLATLVTGNGAIEVAPAIDPYVHGTVVRLTAVPEIGWRFAGWQGDASGTTNPFSVTMDGPKTVEATFERLLYTLTVNQVTGGTIAWEPVKQNYFYNDQVTFTATPDDDYLFTGWTGALSGEAISTTLTIQEDALVSANFTTTPYTVMINASSRGTVNVSPQKSVYSPQEEITLMAMPRDGYRFVRWVVTTTEQRFYTENPLMLIVEENTTIAAEYEEVIIVPEDHLLYLPIVVGQ